MMIGIHFPQPSPSGGQIILGTEENSYGTEKKSGLMEKWKRLAGKQVKKFGQ